MKNIYEDGNNIPASDTDSGEKTTAPSGITEEQEPVRKDRRPYHSAQEKREKRMARLESTAARRAERERSAMPEPQQQYFPQQLQPVQPVMNSTPAQPAPVPVTPRYYIQQAPGQPPQLFTDAPSATHDTGQGQPQGQQQTYTQGMKIVYQSPDFDRAPAPSLTDMRVPVPAQVPVMQAKSPVPPPEKPKYQGGQTFEQELKKSGRYPFQGAEGFSVADVSAEEKRTRTAKFSYERNVEEISLDTAKKKTPLPEAGEHAPIKKKPASPAEKIRVIVLTLSIIVALGALAYLGYEWKMSADNKRLEASLSAEAESEATTAASDENTPTEPTTVLSPEELFAKLKLENPNISYPANLQPRFAQFYTDNQDFVGYLAIKGLNMGLPIVQANDNNEYLKKNFYGKKTKYGCPFVLHLNSMEPLDKNTVIFGHYMKDGSIFAPLHEYKSIEGYRKAPVISFDTFYGSYQWKIIACFLTNVYPEDDNDYVFRYYFTNLGSDAAFEDYIDALNARSLYDTGVDVLPTDRLLTLSTCSYEFTNARFIVVARMVRVGESAEVDVSKATVNKSPRYPQAYYNKKKLKNPHDDTYNWYPG